MCKLVKSLARGVDGPASVVALLCVDGTTGDSDMLVVHALRWAVEGGSSAKAHPGGASGAAAAGSGAARVVLSAGFVDAVRALYTSSPTANFGLIQPVLPALTRGACAPPRLCPRLRWRLSPDYCILFGLYSLTIFMLCPSQPSWSALSRPSSCM